MLYKLHVHLCTMHTQLTESLLSVNFDLKSHKHNVLLCSTVITVHGRICLHCSSYLSTVAGLGEFRIRDLNDEINKLLREKRHWEDRILELGGPDYAVRLSASISSDLSTSPHPPSFHFHLFPLPPLLVFKTVFSCRGLDQRCSTMRARQCQGTEDTSEKCI